jgi:hypothetical protein
MKSLAEPIPERIIISRKGFDSKYGGCASPILPDGTLVSIPIKEEGMPLRYQDIDAEGVGNLGDVVSKLAACNVSGDERVHLDPDLRKRFHGLGAGPWCPMFGQSDAAARHLQKQNVCSGDLFLFFGWFRKVDENLKFVTHADDEHVVWGWLQVDFCLDRRRRNQIGRAGTHTLCEEGPQVQHGLRWAKDTKCRH